MPGVLVDEHGALADPADWLEVESRLERGTFFWLDLHEPGSGELRELARVFGFHPLALEDAEQFGQRPKLEEYDSFVFLVVYGTTHETERRLAEVHCFCSERYLVTVHRVEAAALDELRELYRARQARDADAAMLLYRIVDRLVDGFFDVLAELDDRIDRVESLVFAGPDDVQLQEIFDLKELLVTLRKVVTSERDVFARVATTGVGGLPGLTQETERYYRDLYDHLIRISEVVESDRDLLTGVTDLYLSTSSNRLNAVMKQLSIIATVFLPLSFITSFFGQNFGWLIRHIGSAPAFAILGLGTEVASIVLMVLLFRRRRWM